jgi:nucleoside-diphosphate-sugar epimerase
MKSILVTGSNGLLGKKITETLLHEGYFLTGVSIEKIINDRFQYISANLTNVLEVEKLFNENKFSHVIHLAAIAHAIKGLNISWSKYYRVNTLMSRNIFGYASLREIPIFYSSTVDVYGITKGIINENTKPNPIGYYSTSKYLAEKSLEEVARQPYLIARFAPIYTDENKRDIQRRYYIKYPSLSYLIDGGMEYEFLSAKNVINIVLKWVKAPQSLKGLINVCDEKCYNTKELIMEDKEKGLARNVIKIPKWVKELMRLTINVVFGRNEFLKFSAYKIILPMRFDHKKLNRIFEEI